jgi:hypothetical protein
MALIGEARTEDRDYGDLAGWFGLSRTSRIETDQYDDWWVKIEGLRKKLGLVGL